MNAISSLSSQSYVFLQNVTDNLFNTTQKRITALVLIVLGGLATCYLVYRRLPCFKAQRIAQEIHGNKQIIQDIHKEQLNKQHKAFQKLYDQGKAEELEQMLKKYPDLKIKELIPLAKGTKAYSYVCALYALRALDSNKNMHEKIARVLTSLAFLDNVQVDDSNNIDPLTETHQREFATLLAKKCTPEQASLILDGFLAYKRDKQHLGESFLIPILESKDLEKIKAAFKKYWTCWDEFDTFEPGCIHEILPYIGSKEVLQTIYDVINKDDETDIKYYLKNMFHYTINGKRETYMVNLPQSVIDRIVV